jgi:hypothetical protein
MRGTVSTSSGYPPVQALFEAGRAVAAYHFGLVLPGVSVTKPQKYRLPSWFLPRARPGVEDSERVVNCGARVIAARQFARDVPPHFGFGLFAELPLDNETESFEYFSGPSWDRMTKAADDLYLCSGDRAYPTLVLATWAVADLLQRHKSLTRETVNKHIAAALTAPDPYRTRCVRWRLEEPKSWNATSRL